MVKPHPSMDVGAWSKPLLFSGTSGPKNRMFFRDPLFLSTPEIVPSRFSESNEPTLTRIGFKNVSFKPFLVLSFYCLFISFSLVFHQSFISFSSKCIFAATSNFCRPRKSLRLVILSRMNQFSLELALKASRSKVWLEESRVA